MIIDVNQLIKKRLEDIADIEIKNFIRDILNEEKERMYIKEKTTPYKDNYKKLVDKYINTGD